MNLTALPPVPTHFMGGPSARVALAALLNAIRLARWLAAPAVLWACGAWAALPLLGLAGAVAWSARRRPRPMAAPLAEDALWLLGSAAIVAGGRAAWPAFAAGAGLAVAFAIAWAAGVALTWGWSPDFVVMRRPTFRIIGDNPDARTWVAKMRVRGGRGPRIEVPHSARGPVTVAATRLGLGVAGSVSYRELGPVLVEKGRAVVRLGGVDPEADFALDVPDGPYFVSVRYYQPRDGAPGPRTC